MLSISGPLGLPDYESGEILPSGDSLVVVNATFFSSVSSPYSKTICSEFMCSIYTPRVRLFCSPKVSSYLYRIQKCVLFLLF